VASFAFVSDAPPQVAADVLVLPVYQGPEPGPGVSQVGLAEAFGAAKLRGKRGERLLVMRRDGDGFAADAVMLLGVGEREKVSPDVLRRAMGRAAPQLAKFRSVATTLPQAVPRGDAADGVQATIEGLVLGSYRFDRYRTKPNDDAPPALQRISIVGGARDDGKAAKRAMRRAEIVAEAVSWARDLVNIPALDLPPDGIAKEAQRMARANGLQVKVLGKAELERGGFGGILGVGAGSVNPPRLIDVRYRGGGASSSTIALTGKGIAFDSGGLSLKDAKNMEWMKSDMGGAASILGTMLAIAQLKPKINVTAAIPAAENMPSGSAIRPGDVLHHRGGKTSEVMNTDAEGRLVLADALAYLTEQKPALIIDTATLTGACMVALGDQITGAFGNDAALTREIVDIGAAVGEPVWELPLWPEYHAQIESKVADIQNIGKRWGGAITAALFLEEFVGGIPWVHLDIAGPAFAESPGDYWGLGGTGVPVRTLVEFVTRRADGLGRAAKRG
jgi:leucyl aminopeptidase